MRKLLSVILLLAAVLSGVCIVWAADGDIVVLYTNDVHCGVDDSIGYSGLAAYKKELKEQGKNVLLVDNGDAVQGGNIGTLSKGEAIVDIMNYIGYDIAILGNHEFDYGFEQFIKLTGLANYTYLCCNLTDLTGDKLVLEPYTIKEIGGKRIAFIGVTTPETLTTSVPKHFQNDKGEFVYSFAQNDDGTKLYETVQKTVDKVKNEKADYIVMLAHLGIDESSAPYMSRDVIRNTSGIDVVLDGHSHSLVECEKVKNKDGKDVLLTQTGTKLHAIGKLTIDENGLKTELIDDYTKKDEETTKFINSKKEVYEKLLKEHIGESKFDLNALADDKVTWLARNQETNLGNFVSDAYKQVTNADIGYTTGGSIRAAIPKGEITYGTLLTVSPFGNNVIKIKIKGSSLADALEYAVSFAPGEYGGFPQVSGMTFDLDLNKKADIVTDENGFLKEIRGTERRISNIKVNGEELDPEKYYTFGSLDYIIQEDGDGNTAFKGEIVKLEKSLSDIDALKEYIKSLDGNIPEKYSDPKGEGRIHLGESTANAEGKKAAVANTDKIKIIINDKEVSSDVEPYINNGFTFVPARFVSENLGADVDYDKYEKTVHIKTANTDIEFKTNDTEINVNGKVKNIGSPAVIKENRTMVPLRFVSEAFGANVDWNEDTKTVSIHSAKTEEQGKKIDFEFSEGVEPITWKPSAENLIIKTDEARKLYDRISKNDYPTEEELRSSKVVSQIDELSAYYIALYGNTAEIDTPERNKLREDVKNEFLAIGSARTESIDKTTGRHKYVYDGELKKGYQFELVLGLPASGKSTMVTDPDSEEMGAFILDCDVVKELLPEFKESYGGAADAVHFESFNIMDSAMEEFLTGKLKGTNVILPIVSTDLDELMEKYITPFEKAGYTVTAKYVDVPVNVSMGRNVARELRTGRIIKSVVAFSFGDKPKEVYEELKKMKSSKGEPYVYEEEMLNAA